jgi:transglutaminase-like putative cysteine protease
MLKRLLLSLALLPTLALAAFTPPVTILLDYRDIELQANAGFTKTTEWMVRIDTQQGVDQYGQAKLHFDGKRATQTILEAYTIRPNGEKVTVSPDRIKIRNDEADELAPYFSDDMVTVIIFPQVEVGSKIYYKAVTKQSEPTIKGHYSANMFFTPHRRYEDTRIRLTHPAELSVYAEARDVSGTRSVLPDGRIRYVYQFKQDKAYPPEPNRVELIDFAPGIQLSTFANYTDLANTFQNLMQPKTKVTPQVQQLADKLTADANTPRQKAQKLYNWVSANIRYVGTEVGASGFEPHSADEILANQYGDCKDHVVLLESLLLAVGIESTPALINMSNTFLMPKLAGKQFDHVITYIPSMDLYLDSTAQFAEFGVLPQSEQGKPTLLTQNGQIHATPHSSAKRDYTVTDTKLKLLPDGKIVGSAKYTPHGAYTYSSRSAQFAYEDQDNQTIVDSILGRFQESGTGEMAHGDPNDLSTSWSVKSSFELDPVINIPGKSAFSVPTGLSPGYIKMIAKERPFLNRRYPYVCGSDRHMEHIELVLPNNVRVTKIPDGIKAEIGPQSYKSSYKLSGNTLTVTRELSEEIHKDFCMPSKNETTERLIMMDAIKSDLRSQVFLE